MGGKFIEGIWKGREFLFLKVLSVEIKLLYLIQFSFFFKLSST